MTNETPPAARGPGRKRPELKPAILAYLDVTPPSRISLKRLARELDCYTGSVRDIFQRHRPQKYAKYRSYWKRRRSL